MRSGRDGSAGSGSALPRSKRTPRKHTTSNLHFFIGGKMKNPSPIRALFACIAATVILFSISPCQAQSYNIKTIAGGGSGLRFHLQAMTADSRLIPPATSTFPTSGTTSFEN